MKIVLLITLTLFFSACSEDSVQSNTQKEVTKKVSEVPKIIVEQANTVVDSVKKVTPKVKAQEIASKVTEQVKEEVKKVVTPKVVVAKSSLDGAILFKACSGCHGSHGERKAMGKSHIIKGWDVAKVTHALHGYKDGTYGGSMKGIMKGQASKLDDAKIEAIGKYLSKQ